jgi:NADH-quinone oxidoreductase subunit A
MSPDASRRLKVVGCYDERGMPSGYLPIFVFAILAALFPVVALLLARLVRPSAPNAAKLSAYECGIEPTSQSRGRYSVRFFLVAMLFVIFDVETVFLFPWAVRYRQLGWFGIAEAGVFLAFLVVGYVWVIRKRVLDWS